MASVFTNAFCPNGTYPLFCEAIMLCNTGHDQEVTVRNLLCTQVRQKFCTAEWRILEVNNRSEELIDCQGFGETGLINCTEQFDLADNNSVCLPLCKDFSQHGPSFTGFIVGLNAIVHLVNVIGGIVVIIACIWNRSKMYVSCMYGSLKCHAHSHICTHTHAHTRTHTFILLYTVNLPSKN